MKFRFHALTVAMAFGCSASHGHPHHARVRTHAQVAPISGCQRASPEQVSMVDAGNLRTVEFLISCAAETRFSLWCLQLITPNIESLEAFRCTYGENQVHQLIHPDASTWHYAAQAVHLIQQLENSGIPVCEIYNWWRPEPYNKNVRGAPGRHPFGTSVDIRLCSRQDADKAFQLLCQWRDEGQELRAIGYYGTSRLHLGVSDATPNTWGKNCKASPATF